MSVLQEKEFTKITNRGQLLKIFHQICDRNTILNINFDNDKHTYSSSLLEIDEKKRLLKLDELHPPQGHDSIKKNVSITVHCRHSGNESIFTLKIKKIDIENDIYYYLATFPDQILHYQRRDSLRVAPALMLEPDIVIFKNGFHTEGKLHNISYSGVGGILDGPAAPVMEETYVIQISLNSESPIITKITMKFIGAPGHKGKRRFGANFTELTSEDEQRITSIVNKIQRHFIRRGNIG